MTTMQRKTNRILACTLHTNYQSRWWRGNDFSLFCSHSTWAPCSHQVKRKLLCKYSGQMWICPTAKAWQYNDPKHNRTSTTERLNRKRTKCLQRSSQSPAINQFLRLRKLCINKSTQTSMNSSNVIKKSGAKFLHNDMRGWKKIKETTIIGDKSCWILGADLVLYRTS